MFGEVDDRRERSMVMTQERRSPEAAARRGDRAGYASLKDVARRAGVSFQTVSKVLNGGGTVAPATLERIHRAAEEVGYVPNALARGLVTRDTRTIGIVAADPSDHGLGRFVLGAEVEARRRGWATVVANVDAFGSDVTRCVEVLSERRVDGILMAAPQAESDPALGERLRDRLPVVGLHHIDGLRVPLVGSDHVQTGRLAVGHLVDHGHRAIGVVAGPLQRSVTGSRMAGYVRALRDAGLRRGDDTVEEGDWTTPGGYRATLRLLARAPSLTSIRIPFDETGHTAMALLINVIGGEAPPTSSTLLPVELVARASCGCTIDDLSDMGSVEIGEK
jgi:LacI family transcriptional regulator